MAGRRPLAPADIVARVLQDYAARAVFRSLSDPEARRGRTAFALTWHHGRRFRLLVDPAARVVSFPELLPGVPARSPMQRELRAFLRRFESDEVPAHRRLDPAKGRLRVAARAGRVSLGIAVRGGEWESCTRRLVHLAHEVFLVFLPDGPYADYRVEQLGVDPDAVWT